jgi:hypothetical protein
MSCGSGIIIGALLAFEREGDKMRRMIIFFLTIISITATIMLAIIIVC